MSRTAPAAAPRARRTSLEMLGATTTPLPEAQTAPPALGAKSSGRFVLPKFLARPGSPFSARSPGSREGPRPATPDGDGVPETASDGDSPGAKRRMSFLPRATSARAALSRPKTPPDLAPSHSAPTPHRGSIFGLFGGSAKKVDVPDGDGAPSPGGGDASPPRARGRGIIFANKAMKGADPAAAYNAPGSPGKSARRRASQEDSEEPLL